MFFFFKVVNLSKEKLVCCVYIEIINCDKIENTTLRQQCFFEVMTQLIQEKLSVDTLSILYPELDTIEVKVTIFPNATMQF